MEIGLLDWFNENKGYGLIRTPDNNEVFLHITNWVDSIALNEIDRLPLLFNVGFRRGKITALDCESFKVENTDHWEALFSYHEHGFSIRVRYTEFNLFRIVLQSLDQRFDYLVVAPFFKKVVSNLTESDLFDRGHWIFQVSTLSLNDELTSFVTELLTNRIHDFGDQNVIKFWKESIMDHFVPTEIVLANGYHEIGVSELKLIQSEEVKNLIVIKKLQAVTNNYSREQFLMFDDILATLSSDRLKVKIARDLLGICTRYIEDVKIEIGSLTKKDGVTFSQIRQVYSTLPNFLTEDILLSITEHLRQKIINNCSFRMVLECWNGDLIDVIDDYLRATVKNQNLEDLEYFLSSERNTVALAKIVLDHLLDLAEYEIVLKKSKTISAQLFADYDQLIFNTIQEEQYFTFWKRRIASITPANFLSEYLDHRKSNYLELEKLVHDEVISDGEAKEMLYNTILGCTGLGSRSVFYTLYNSVKALSKMDSFSADFLGDLKDPNISLILWHLGLVDIFDFETLKRTYLYFYPQEQVYILKRLFYLKHTNQIDFDLERLDEILRTDIETFIKNDDFSNDFVLDISTHVLIESMKSFVKTGSFVFESDLILKDLSRNAKRRFKIAHYFDKCEGRLTAQWNWSTQGKISVIRYGNDQHYFAIQFDAGTQVQTGGYTYWEPNGNFEKLVNAVRQLPRSRWNPTANHWGVPAAFRDEVWIFAQEHRFFIHLDDNRHYDNNLHLVEYTRNTPNSRLNNPESNIPPGIIFCEGRKANREDRKFKKQFWWCGGQKCFQNCCVSHLSREYERNVSGGVAGIWKEYTLLDFLHILQINVDTHKGQEYIKDGKYFEFLGHINAFNRLLDRLYCHECESLLYPSNSSHFALYRDVRFSCIEETCSKRHEEVYLNHCLYGECKTIIDSRVSKRCKHGLFICSNCGSCCSEEFFERRLRNLEEVGGYVQQDLRHNVENREGHLEKKEYYCHKCAGMMTEINTMAFKCFDCNLEYDLSRFKWLSRKWTEIERRRGDYPILE